MLSSQKFTDWHSKINNMWKLQIQNLKFLSQIFLQVYIYIYDKMRIWDIAQITRLHMHSRQMHMWVKFDISVKNITGLIDINVVKENKYDCQIMNTWDITQFICAYVEYIDEHVYKIWSFYYKYFRSCRWRVFILFGPIVTSFYLLSKSKFFVSKRQSFAMLTTWLTQVGRKYT